MSKSPRKTLARGLLLAALTCAPPLSADLYIGAGTYRSEAQFQDLDDNDDTTAVFLGYTFIDTAVMLSAELGRYDLGSYRSAGNDIEAEAITLSAVLGIALGPFLEIYAKTGLASTDIDINGLADDSDESFSGFGASLDLLDTLDFYAEYIDFDTDIDSSLLGVGVRLSF